MAQYVFIHGLGQGPSSWDKAVSLMSKPVPALCPDLFALPGYDEATYANLYRAFSDYCGDISGPLNLCGLSLGAVLALHYAAEHPERLRSLALIGAQYRMPKALLKLQNIIFRLMPQSAFAKPGLGKRDIIRLTASMADLDFSGRLKDIACPAMIICGERDTANKKAATALAASLPNAELRLVDGAGHEVNLDAPEKLAAILDAFWQGCE